MAEIAYYYLDARRARLFRKNEPVTTGQTLGWGSNNETVVADCDGSIETIQYDVWREQVIVGIAPAKAAAAVFLTLQPQPSLG